MVREDFHNPIIVRSPIIINVTQEHHLTVF